MFIGDSSSLSNLKFNNNNNNIYVSKNSNKIPNGKAEVGNMAKNNKNMRGSRNMNGNMDINEDAASKGLVWKKIKKTM
jgi:hypothetical protein